LDPQRTFVGAASQECSSFLGGQLFRFATKLSNSAAVLPKLDVTNVGHLLGAYLCLVIINALMVDSFNVMAGRGE
jgi:hypothetical protein